MLRGYAERSRIERFCRALGRRLRSPLRRSLVGGTVVVDLGLREATLDIDYVVQADHPSTLDAFERLIPILKNELDVNLEPARPADFLPVPGNILERSPSVRSSGNVHRYDDDLPTTVISKAARGAERDLDDVVALIRAGAVSWEAVEQRWQEIRQLDRGWIRYRPDDVARRLQVIRHRLTQAPSDSSATNPLHGFTPQPETVSPRTAGPSGPTSPTASLVYLKTYRRRNGAIVREHWRRRPTKTEPA